MEKDIERVENVQRRAIRQVAGLAGSTYEEKCKELNLDTLRERRRKQDLTQTFKIIRGLDRLNPEKLFNLQEGLRATRQSTEPYYLRPELSRTEIRRNFFSQRVIADWNGLDAKVKTGSLTQFKSALRTLPDLGARRWRAQ